MQTDRTSTSISMSRNMDCWGYPFLDLSSLAMVCVQSRTFRFPRLTESGPLAPAAVSGAEPA